MKIILFLFLLLTFNGTSRTLNYEITSNGSKIGKLSVTKTTKDNVTEIEIISEVKVKIFVTVDIKYQLNTTYKDNELFYSSVTTYVNGKVRSTNKAEKDGKYYTLTSNGHSSKYINKITFTSSMLYFEEPKNKSNLFSEFDNFEKSIKKLGDHSYQIIDPNNSHANVYTYLDGIVNTCTIYNTFMNFTLTKI